MAIINLNGLNVRTFRKVLDHATCKQTLTNVQERVLYKIITQRNMVSAGRIPEGARKAARELYIEMEEKKALLPEISPARVKRWDQIQANIASLQRIESELFQPQKKLGETELLAMNDQLEQIVKVISSHRGLERMAGSIALEIGDRLAELSEREAIQARGAAQRHAFLGTKIPVGQWVLSTGDNTKEIAEIVDYLRQTQGSLIIGRKNNVNVAHILIDQPGVSISHAEIGFDGQDFWIKDLDSSNGVYLCGSRIKPQTKHEVVMGELVYLGKYSFALSDRVQALVDQPNQQVVPEPVLVSPAVIINSNPVKRSPAVVIDGEQVVSAEAMSLRAQVRSSSRPLLMTRNVDLREFADIVSSNCLRPEGVGNKYYRVGLGAEYGDLGSVLVIVMRAGFWETEKDRSTLGNLFLEKLNGQKIVKDIGGYVHYIPAEEVVGEFGGDKSWQQFFANPDDKFLRFKTVPEEMYEIIEASTLPEEKKRYLNRLVMRSNYLVLHRVIDPSISRDQLLRDLTTSFEYNRLLAQVESPSASYEGRTVMGTDVEKCMSYYPQLEVQHAVSVDQIGAVLVPEHMWDEVSAMTAGNPALFQLLRKVEGSGQTKEAFIQGRDKMARRSRKWGGGFELHFGYEAFYRFEQEYLKLILSDQMAVAPPIVNYKDAVKGMMSNAGYLPVEQSGWIYAFPNQPAKYEREENDWKIFVNPRYDYFINVFETVLGVLQLYKELGIQLKIPIDLNEEWRPGRVFGKAANTPKIVIYVNRQSLPEIIHKLNHVLLVEFMRQAHFVRPNGEAVGPSFTKEYGNSGLVFYKMERFVNGRDERVLIAEEAERLAEAEGLSDPLIIMERKKSALAAAGYVGDNAYRFRDDADPLEGV